MPASPPPDPTRHLNPGERPTKSLQRAWAAILDEALDASGFQADEQVHRFRVTLKRLRGLLQLLRPRMSVNRWRRKDRELRDLGRKLANARDAFVAEKTREKIGAASEVPEETTNPIPVEEILAAVRRRLQKLASRPLRAPRGFHGWNLVRTGTRETYAQARRAYRTWREDHDLSAAHECRKYVKYLLYQVEWIEPLDREGLGELKTQLQELGHALGNLNDLSEFAKHVAETEDAGPARRALHEAEPVAMKMARDLLKKSPAQFVNRLSTARAKWRAAGA